MHAWKRLLRQRSPGTAVRGVFRVSTWLEEGHGRRRRHRRHHRHLQPRRHRRADNHAEHRFPRHRCRPWRVKTPASPAACYLSRSSSALICCDRSSRASLDSFHQIAVLNRLVFSAEVVVVVRFHALPPSLRAPLVPFSIPPYFVRYRFGGTEGGKSCRG